MERDFSTNRLMRLFTAAPNAFWRFDVDTDLAAAVKMARFAQVAGIKGTFYMWPTSPFYNVFSVEGREAVAAIEAAGQSLGLHCDVREFMFQHVNAMVDRDFRILDTAYPDKFKRAVSFHMPPKELLWCDDVVSQRWENAYATKWEGRYVSDSRGVFTAGHEARVNDQAQVALHAEHWFGREHSPVGSTHREGMARRAERREPIGGGMVPYS